MMTLDNLLREFARVIAIDAGGTNLRVSLVLFGENGRLVTEYREVYPMPGSRGHFTREQFFDTLAEYLAPVADKSDCIGFCFSYPCESLPNRDGKVRRLTNYAKAPRNAIDRAFDASTVSPGSYQFEKMISGAYQGGLLLEYIREAAKQGCFSPKFCAGLEVVDVLHPSEADRFLAYPLGGNKLADLCGDSGPRPLCQLIDAFYFCVAALTTVGLSAVIKKSGAGSDPLRPVCVSAEGSTFYKSPLLNRLIHYRMEDFAQRQMRPSFEFTRASDATIPGTAIAAVTRPASHNQRMRVNL